MRREAAGFEEDDLAARAGEVQREGDAGRAAADDAQIRVERGVGCELRGVQDQGAGIILGRLASGRGEGGDAGGIRRSGKAEKAVRAGGVEPDALGEEAEQREGDWVRAGRQAGAGGDASRGVEQRGREPAFDG